MNSRDTTALAGKAFTFAIGGMTCASCVALVENALRKVPGVTDASVNLATEKALVKSSAEVTSQRLIDIVTRAGYEATLDVGLPAPVAVPAGLPSWWAVAVAATLSLPLLLPMLARFTLSGWLQLLLARVLSR